MHQPRYTVSLTAADVGERVMLRYALPEGDEPARSDPDEPTLTDVVGDLVAWSRGVLRISTRTGVVDVAESAVVAAKRVPPRRVARAADASVAEVQRRSALSWQALETERLGGWRLRAGGGFTGRANSVLPLGEPGLPLEAALDYVERWYGDRGLVPRFQLPQPDAAPLSAALAERGWNLVDSADVMVGEVSAEPAQGNEQRWDLPAVVVADAPSPAWLGAYHYRGGRLPKAGYAVLTHHRDPGFASVEQDGRVVAIARGAVDDGWLGIAAVEVDPAHRRRGLGRHVTRGLLQWGQARGARHAHLQVDVNNQAGKALYTGLGFTFHHRYDYRTQP
ncbi:MAG: N-acetylglutamate synthase [Frankiales bacterium]|nr:N-acetylglutamate synthase [Frankiales bacterium]